MLTALFKAYLEEGKDIADFDVLSDIAESTGMMTKEEVRFIYLLLLCSSSAFPFNSIRDRPLLSSSQTSS